MSKVISIIVPIYNVEKYLDKCINSIVSQTYTDLQIILVDDGSSDKSGEICDYYKVKDKRIVVIHQNNEGLVKARKAGLEIATGDYIGFVDGDDYVEKEMFEKMLEHIVRTDADFVHAGYMKNDETQIRGTGKYSEIILNNENRNKNIIELIFDLRKGQIMSPCLCFKLFKDDIIKKAYAYVPDNQSYGEDLIALCKAIYMCSKVLIVDEGYYHYIVRNDSIMNAVDRNMLLRENRLRECLVNLTTEIGNYYEIKDFLDIYWLTGIIDDLKRMIPEDIRVFNCELIHILRGKKIILYGAGAVGKDYYSQIRMYMDIDLVMWTDKNSENIMNEYCEIRPVELIGNFQFDYILIAVLSQEQADNIKSDLMSMGIEKNKILWKRPVMSSTL